MSDTMDDALVQAWRDGEFDPNSNDITGETQVRLIPAIVTFCINHSFLTQSCAIHKL
jgi:hypothetical protein